MGINYAAIIASLGLTATVAVIIIATQSTPNVTIDAMIEKPLPADCSNGQEEHLHLNKSTSPVLQKLAEYESVCNGAVVDQLMTFAAMPTSIDEARIFARTIASELKEFGQNNIAPLVVFEPPLKKPDILKQIRSGEFDDTLTEYYASLKREGLNDNLMGTWVLFPEANTPSWSTTDPQDFSANVTKVASLQKATFPGSKVTLLLNSMSYPDHDTDWSHGQRKSLAPYLNNIPEHLVDSFGYQGFPYVPPANSSDKKQIDPKQFLDADIAAEAAKILNVKAIWLNTGTFKVMHANSPIEKVILSPTQRDEILKGVLEQVKILQSSKLAVTLNLFSQDKSILEEAVDWSYWKAGKPKESQDTSVFDMFIRRLRANDVLVSLYDSTP